MSLRSRLRSLWRNVAHSDRVERDLDNELNAALGLLVDEHLQKGATPAEARRAALLQLGQVESIKTQVRDSRGGAGIESLWYDVRFSLRQLARSRSFTTAAVVSLAPGMGANGAVFGLLNALRLRSLPVADAGQLAEIRLSGPRCCRHTGRNRQMSLPLWQEIVGEVVRNQISNGYFTAMEMPVIAGRPFDDRDTPQSPKAAIVNGTFARRFFPGAAPLGQRFKDGDDEFEVVGLVRDSKQYFLREDFRPIFYTAASQVATPPSSIMRFVIRSQIGTAAITDSVRRAITGASPSAGIRFAAMTDQTAQSIGREQLMATLSVFFGLTALALAIVGVYGVVSYTAASRQREIGIRLALGARAAHVVRTVLARLAVTSSVGLVTGAIVTASVSATAATFLYGMEPRDPRILTLTMGVVVVAALAAAVVPVWRALAIDPVRALKDE